MSQLLLLGGLFRITGSSKLWWLETALFTATAGNPHHLCLSGWLENPVYLSPAGSYTFAHSSQGCSGMTLYGYARVSVREPGDKNLDLQVERLVRAGCSLGNIRAEEASGARNDRGGLLELLDLVVEGDTMVVTHIDRLSRGLTHGLQVIEGLHRAGVEFRLSRAVTEWATGAAESCTTDMNA